MRKFQWPLMLRSTHEEVRRENWELRGALQRVNEELRKHRLLIGSLRNAEPAAMRAVERATKQH